MKISNHLVILRLLAGSFVLVLAGSSARAAVAIYSGLPTGDWGTVGNWSTGAVPGAGDDVTVDDNAAQNTVVNIAPSSTRRVLTLTVDAGDSVVLGNNSTLEINGDSLDLDGDLRIDAAASFTNLSITGATSLTGTGAVVLGDASNNNRIVGTGLLTNSATIEGRGHLGANQLGIVNAAGGVIDANVSFADNPGATLLVDPRNAGGLTNQGMLRASGGGRLQLTGGFGGGFLNSGGTIEAVGEGSEVQLLNFVSITGGTLHTEDGGLIRGNGSQNYYFTDVTFDAGTRVQADNNSDFGVLGTITNGGTIMVAAGSSATDIELQGDTVFSGGGQIVLDTTDPAVGNAGINGIGVLTNGADHSIVGRGRLGQNVLGIINNGTITADGGATGAVLFVDPSGAGSFDNNAILQATGGSSLQLTGAFGGAFFNDGGTIQALGAGSEVQLVSGSSIVGGTLHTEDGGLIRGNVSQDYFFTDVTFDAGTRVQADNNSDFGVLGTIANGGTITVAAGSSATDIELQGDTVFSGGGQIVLDTTAPATGNAGINGSGTLTNGADHSVVGRGRLGQNVLGIVNNGTITADGGVPGAILFVDPSGAGNFDNNATLQATGGSYLQLTGAFGGAFFNDGGTIQALGAGSEVQLVSGSSIVGGTLHTEDGGLIRGNVSQDYFFTDVTFDAGTRVQADNNSDFGVLGTITNGATITVAAGSSATDIELQGDTVFSGGGQIVLDTTDPAVGNAGINGIGVLTNGADHSIVGRGRLGQNVLGIINNGTITADGGATGAVLFVDPSGAGSFDNNAILQATGGSSLQLTGAFGGAFFNDGGTIQALGAGSEVQLVSGSSIVGGTLHTEDGGLIRGNGSQNYYFTDVTFDAGTRVQADNNSDFGVLGTITNGGTITVAAGSSATDIELQGDTAFSGDGQVVLDSTGVAASNAGINGSGLLTNATGHTIRGHGAIGQNVISVFNASGAAILADVDTKVLALNPRADAGASGFRNRGLLGSSNGGILELSGGFGGSFDNEGGVIRADDESEVRLRDSVAINGGRLETSGTGSLHLPSGQTAFLSDVDLAADMLMDNGSSLRLSGDFNHDGDLTMNSVGSSTSVFIDGVVELDGGGRINMASSNTRILGSGVLINRDYNIAGAGQLGANQLGLTNSSGGTIHANLDGESLTIDPNAFLGFVNDGTLRASDGGSINLSGGFGGQFTFGDDSLLEALDGGTITHSAGASLTNLQGGTLTGGAYRVADRGNGASLSLPGGDIMTNAADISLSGAGASFSQLGNLSLNEGALSVDNGASLGVSGDLTQAATGSLDIGISGNPDQTNLWGSLTASGQVILDGVLNLFVNVGNTFTAAIGDVWQIVTAASRESEFSEVNVTAGDLPAGSRITVDYVEDGVEVALVSEGQLRLAEPTYENWAVAWGVDGNLEPLVDPLDPLGDPDRDSATNLEEYAYGMDPTVADSWRLPRLQMIREGDQRFASISYTRPSGAELPSDVIYTVESSLDLESWKTTGLTISDPESTDEAGKESITVRFEDPIEVVGAQAFMRVRLRLVR